MSSFNVLLIGAGEINFGSVEGVWNHTARLERKLGSRLQVVGLVDPDGPKAEQQVKSKQSDLVGKAYETCKVFKSVQDAAAGLSSNVMKPQWVRLPLLLSLWLLLSSGQPRFCLIRGGSLFLTEWLFSESRPSPEVLR